MSYTLIRFFLLLLDNKMRVTREGGNEMQRGLTLKIGNVLNSLGLHTLRSLAQVDEDCNE